MLGQSMRASSGPAASDWWGYPPPEMLQKTSLASIFLVPVRVVDELPAELLGLLRFELLPAVRALEAALDLDPDIYDGAVARLGRGRDLHGLRHRRAGAPM